MEDFCTHLYMKTSYEQSASYMQVNMVIRTFLEL